MGGEATSAQLAGFAVALRAKGETAAEVAGLVDSMLAHAVRVHGAGAGRRHRRNRRRPGEHGQHLDDGGDRHRRRRARRWSSTATGPRRASAAPPTCWRGSGWRSRCPPTRSPRPSPRSASGSASRRCYHPSLPARRPAAPGAGHPDGLQLPRPADQPGAAGGRRHRLRQRPDGAGDGRGVRRRAAPDVLLFRGDDGLDELTTTTTSTVWEVRGGAVRQLTLRPRPMSVSTAPTPADLRGGDVAQNVAVARALFAGETGRGPGRRGAECRGRAGRARRAHRRSGGRPAGRRGKGKRRAGFRCRRDVLERWVSAGQRLSSPAR